MGYRVIDRETYYRRGVFRHFSEDCKCSTSMTARIDVTRLAEESKRAGTKFSVNFLYLLSKVLNSREDYRMGWLWQTQQLICWDVVHPTQYVFHEDTETCTPVYTTYTPDYAAFYAGAVADIERARATREYGLDAANHPNWFDASYIPWLSYDALNIELPDGYLYFAPIVNWGRYRQENGRLMMPVSVRLNHAIADGYLVANVFRLLQRAVDGFAGGAPGEGDGRQGEAESDRTIPAPAFEREREGTPMNSIRIADTTREERERIVAESIGNIDGTCDGCSPGLVEMYRDYIEGRRELREINMEFQARYISGAAGPARPACQEAEGVV